MHWLMLLVWWCEEVMQEGRWGWCGCSVAAGSQHSLAGQAVVEDMAASMLGCRSWRVGAAWAIEEEDQECNQQ